MAINIPYGYIIKSRKGNSYIKTPSGWVSNGKPANQGIIKNLEAAAERKIEEYNDNSDNLVKIGQEYKSNNGKVYFYNGTNFMSADGKKKLAGGAQESAMRKLQQSAETNGGESGEAEPTRLPVNHETVPVGFSTRHDEFVYTKTPTGWDAYKNGEIVDKVKSTGSGWVNEKGEEVNSDVIMAITDKALGRIKAYNNDPSHEMKIGDSYTHGEQSYMFNGSEFITRDGKQLAHEYVPQAKAKLVSDAKKQQETATEEPPSGEEPSAEVTEPNTNDVEPSGAVDEPESSTQDAGGKSLQDLADIINNHPQKRKLVALMSRGDKVSLIAADIILAGKAAEAVKELTANQ